MSSETQTHGHVDPNSLSLTPSLAYAVPAPSSLTQSPGPRFGSIPRTEPRSTSEPTQSRRPGESDHRVALHPAVRDSPEAAASSELTEMEDDGGYLSEAEPEPRSSSRPSSSVDGRFDVEFGTRNRHQAEQDVSDTDAGAVQDDSDSDYSPEIPTRLRRRSSNTARHSSTQPKRGIRTVSI